MSELVGNPEDWFSRVIAQIDQLSQNRTNVLIWVNFVVGRKDKLRLKCLAQKTKSDDN